MLVDDHKIVREGTRSILESQSDIRVVAEAATAHETYEVLQQRENSCDVVILDLGLPDENGVAVAEHLRTRHSTLPVVVLTAHDGTAYRLRLLQVGVTAFLDKGCSGDELIRTLRAVVRGDYVVTAQAGATIRAFAAGKIQQLTERELEVLGLVAAGLSNKEIAGRLFVSERTVEFHMANVMGKLGAASRVDAIRRARAEGWLV